LVQLTKDKVYA